LSSVEASLKRTRDACLGKAGVPRSGVRAFDGPVAFAEAVLRVFANTIQYNFGLSSAANQMPLELCEAAQHLGAHAASLMLESPNLLLAAAAAAANEKAASTKVRILTTISHPAPEAKPAWYHPGLDLTDAARDDARLEREAAVLAAPIGETARECERLLKQLNMTNDKKHSWHFEAPIDLKMNPTYTQVISKPTSRKQCEDRLARGEFGTMGGLVAELRNVYGNALKFNGPGEALGNKAAKEICESARFMQGRLETKLRVLVLDAHERLGRQQALLRLDRARVLGAQGLSRERNKETDALVERIKESNKRLEHAQAVEVTERELARQEALSQVTGNALALSAGLRSTTDRLNIQSGAEVRRLEALRAQRVALAEQRMLAARARHAAAAERVWKRCREAQQAQGDQAKGDQARAAPAVPSDLTEKPGAPPPGPLLEGRPQPVKLTFALKAATPPRLLAPGAPGSFAASGSGAPGAPRVLGAKEGKRPKLLLKAAGARRGGKNALARLFRSADDDGDEEPEEAAPPKRPVVESSGSGGGGRKRSRAQIGGDDDDDSKGGEGGGEKRGTEASSNDGSGSSGAVPRAGSAASEDSEELVANGGVFDLEVGGVALVRELQLGCAESAAQVSRLLGARPPSDAAPKSKTQPRALVLVSFTFGGPTDAEADAEAENRAENGAGNEAEAEGGKEAGRKRPRDQGANGGARWEARSGGTWVAITSAAPCRPEKGDFSSGDSSGCPGGGWRGGDLASVTAALPGSDPGGGGGGGSEGEWVGRLPRVLAALTATSNPSSGCGDGLGEDALWAQGAGAPLVVAQLASQVRWRVP